MQETQPQPVALPTLYKGLALFTPGGDLVYCIDPSKQGRWHHHLCSVLQEWLDLPEPPLFLTPCYTATLDYWFDPQTRQLRVAAEAYPLVLRHQAILNTIFATDLAWQPVPCPAGLCDPLVLKSYQQQFPQLWQHHNLVIRSDALARKTLVDKPLAAAPPQPPGYVFHLFVAGSSLVTEQVLKSLHTLLGQSLQQPYTLKVIDVVKQPEQAEADHVTATPTLVRVWPKPVRRLVGGLENPDRLLYVLGTRELETKGNH
ncbi:MAG: circadian clock KaiB family protein [Aphanocapsa sp. GSE-SYN-MK-11-07L]|nr:circadian clock KaiB family protein [Aphanocapsa sp. GSE-SYN-MK-11-07L]